MGIQERLKLQRYGERGYFIPIDREIKQHIPTIHSETINRKVKYKNIADKIWNALYIPKPKDRYYKHNHGPLMDDFKKIKTDNTFHRLIHKRLIRPLVYFHMFPEQYGNNFEHFAVPWITTFMFGMRAAVMEQMYNRGEIPYTFAWKPESNAQYPLYKPQLPKTTIQIANEIHNILEDALKEYQLLVEKHSN